MADVISLRGDQHQQAFELLPWYATGQLDEADLALVETHLEACAECQAELKFQRRLLETVSATPVAAEDGWRRMRDRIERGDAARDRALAPAQPTLGGRPAWHLGGARLGWAVAACLALALGAVLVAPQAFRPAPYHVLGAAPVDAAGDVIVMFRPDTREQALRQILDDSRARLVDGPTAAGAYVLHVPLAQRAAALGAMRKRAEVLSAEPIDAGGPP